MEWKRSHLPIDIQKIKRLSPKDSNWKLANIYSVYHLYVALAEERDELVKYLHCNGIACGIYYPVPLHLQKAYKSLNYNKGEISYFRICFKKSYRPSSLSWNDRRDPRLHNRKIKDFYLGR